MRIVVGFFLLVWAAFAQNPNTAVYPGGVAADKDLGVQLNHQQTTLTAPLSAGATSATVASCSGFLNYTPVGIDTEILMQCSCSGSTMQFGKSSCPNADGRGLDTAAGAGSVSSHVAGSSVLGYIMALQHNQLAKEVEAIEGALPSPSGVKTRSCQIAIGLPGAASPALANDNDAPAVCGNDFGTNWTILSVDCWADAGSPTVQPILTGGSATSILTGVLTCGTASWAAGSVNGSPVVHSFSGTGATCSVTPCTLDADIVSAGGTAKYIIMRFKGTI